MNHYRCCECNSDVMAEERPENCPSCNSPVLLLWQSAPRKPAVKDGTLAAYMLVSHAMLDNVTESGDEIYFHMSDGAVLAATKGA